jgi:molybdopterin-guanine dinucleotide biosynthesis protein A
MKSLVLVVLIAFTALNVYGVAAGGIDALLALLETTNPWMFVFGADLVIALSMVAVWLIRDAKKSGRSAAPFVVLTAATGSIGPLLYLVTRKAARS